MMTVFNSCAPAILVLVALAGATSAQPAGVSEQEVLPDVTATNNARLAYLPSASLASGVVARISESVPVRVKRFRWV